MERDEELLEKWKSQFRKGFLELCLLELLSAEGRSYGLAIMERMRELGLDISEGTLYPLLMRLTKDGSIASNWETPEVGHPRKYYIITSLGKALLSAMIEEYDKSQAVRVSISRGGRAE
ncbi:MAG: PadR family transcriptional regulator [Spirochaetia bacterium]|jgi:PadR family transcriptional regulator PadR|nr:PadR family transcriptional regulator [Spirochaetia bacterium]